MVKKSRLEVKWLAWAGGGGWGAAAAAAGAAAAATAGWVECLSRRCLSR